MVKREELIQMATTLMGITKSLGLDGWEFNPLTMKCWELRYNIAKLSVRVLDKLNPLWREMAPKVFPKLSRICELVEGGSDEG